MVHVAQTFCPRHASLELRIAMGLELILKPSVFALARLVLKNGSARKKLAQPSHLLLLVGCPVGGGGIDHANDPSCPVAGVSWGSDVMCPDRP